MSAQLPVAKTAMLIRRPVSEVFDAFINPEIISKLWFTHTSGQLEEGNQLVWKWEMYNYSTPVNIKKIVPNKSIIFEWGNYDNMTTVEWTFEDMKEQGTYVTIVNSGFQGNQAELISQIGDSTKGFTFLLAGVKAYLEHGVLLNLVRDAFPQGLVK